MRLTLRSITIFATLVSVVAAKAQPLEIRATVEKSFFVETYKGYCIAINDSEVVTCYHLLKDSKNIKIIQDERVFSDLTVLKVSPDYDLAMLKINNGKLHGPFQTVNNDSLHTDKLTIVYKKDKNAKTTTVRVLRSGNLSGLQDVKGKSVYHADANVILITEAPSEVWSGAPALLNNLIVGIYVKGTGAGDYVIPAVYLTDMKTATASPLTMSWPTQRFFVDTLKKFIITKDTSVYLAGYYRFLQYLPTLMQTYKASTKSFDTFDIAFEKTMKAVNKFLEEPNIETFEDFTPVYKRQIESMRVLTAKNSDFFKSFMISARLLDSVRNMMVDQLSSTKDEALTADQKRLMNLFVPKIQNKLLSIRDSFSKDFNAFNEGMKKNIENMSQFLECGKQNPNRPYDNQANCMPRFFLPAQEGLKEATEGINGTNRQKLLLESVQYSCALLAVLLMGM